MRNSTHAAMRMQQRGITKDIIALFEAYADHETHAGSGAVSFTLTKDALADMESSDVKRHDIDRVQSLAVVYSGDRAATVLKLFGRKARRYRIGMRPWSARSD